MTTIFISRDATNTKATVRFAYDPTVVETIKTSVPATARAWSAKSKIWVIHTAFLNGLTVRLRRAGHTVDDITPGRAETPAAEVGNAWASVLFAAVGPDRVEPVFRALTRVLHPDVATGSTTLQQQLNAARAALPSHSTRRAA